MWFSPERTAVTRLADKNFIFVNDGRTCIFALITPKEALKSLRRAINYYRLDAIQNTP
jgi:sugar-specific transcriptional regulator TrmB